VKDLELRLDLLLQKLDLGGLLVLSAVDFFPLLLDLKQYMLIRFFKFFNQFLDHWESLFYRFDFVVLVDACK
jgi:hypothetical protein